MHEGCVIACVDHVAAVGTAHRAHEAEMLRDGPRPGVQAPCHDGDDDSRAESRANREHIPDVGTAMKIEQRTVEIDREEPRSRPRAHRT